jgi:hypothetical protein
MDLPPIDAAGADILKLPVKPALPRDGSLFLVPPPASMCIHFNGPFEVDEDGGKCKCLRCGGEVTPMFVLHQLMRQESQWVRTRAAYLDEMKRLDERASTKCQHCGKMTRISRR